MLCDIISLSFCVASVSICTKLTKYLTMFQAQLCFLEVNLQMSVGAVQHDCINGPTLWLL